MFYIRAIIVILAYLTNPTVAMIARPILSRLRLRLWYMLYTSCHNSILK